MHNLLNRCSFVFVLVVGIPVVEQALLGCYVGNARKCRIWALFLCDSEEEEKMAGFLLM
jgi:hypothetical protein